MSLLYLTLFNLLIKGFVILHNKVFLLTVLSLPPSLSLHTFFRLIFQFKCRFFYKNLVTFFSSINLIQPHNLIQLKLYPHYPSNFVLFILLVHTIYEDGIECSETSAHKIQTPGNHAKERIQHPHHGESLKSRLIQLVIFRMLLLHLLAPFSF